MTRGVKRANDVGGTLRGLMATKGFLNIFHLGWGDAKGFGEDGVGNTRCRTKKGTSNKGKAWILGVEG